MNDYYLYILITLMVANVKTKTLKGTLEKIEKDKICLAFNRKFLNFVCRWRLLCFNFSTLFLSPKIMIKEYQNTACIYCEFCAYEFTYGG